MRKAVIVLFLFSFHFVFAQKETVSPIGTQASETNQESIITQDSIGIVDLENVEKFDEPLAPSLLWKIDHDSIATSSYLFGTMHLPDSRVIELFNEHGNTIDQCEAVAVELILKPSDAFSMMPSMVMKDSTLRDFYSPDEYKKVDAVIKSEMGMLSMFANKMKPVFISTTIQQMRFGGDIKYVVDQYIQDEAKKLGKELIGIETVEEQMGALTGMPLKMQAEMLLDYVSDIEKNDSLTHVLVDTYLDQSLSGLLDIYSEDELPEEMNDNLVIIRNIKMSRRIAKMMRKQATFVAVGALHLPGETGLINMLREAGFTVEASQKK